MPWRQYSSTIGLKLWVEPPPNSGSALNINQATCHSCIRPHSEEIVNGRSIQSAVCVIACEKRSRITGLEAKTAEAISMAIRAGKTSLRGLALPLTSTSPITIKNGTASQPPRVWVAIKPSKPTTRVSTFRAISVLRKRVRCQPIENVANTAMSNRRSPYDTALNWGKLSGRLTVSQDSQIAVPPASQVAAINPQVAWRNHCGMSVRQAPSMTMVPRLTRSARSNSVPSRSSVRNAARVITPKEKTKATAKTRYSFRSASVAPNPPTRNKQMARQVTAKA